MVGLRQTDLSAAKLKTAADKERIPINPTAAYTVLSLNRLRKDM